MHMVPKALHIDLPSAFLVSKLAMEVLVAMMAISGDIDVGYEVLLANHTAIIR